MIGRIQLEKLDDSTGSTVMTKEDAVAKWPRWKSNTNTIRNEESFTPEYRYAYLCDRGGNIIKEIDKYVQLPLDDVTDDPFENLVAKIEIYLKKDPALIICARRTFGSTEQLDTENIDDFVRRLNKAADACDWDMMQRDARIRDQFIQGCMHRRVVLNSATMPDLTPATLEFLVSKTKLEEAVVKEEKRKASATVTPRATVAVHALDSKYAQRQRSSDQWSSGPSLPAYRQPGSSQTGRKRDYQGRPKTCTGCGGDWHSVKADCKAYNDTCDFCNKTGHWMQVCRQRIKQQGLGSGTQYDSQQQQGLHKTENTKRYAPQTKIHETTLEDDTEDSSEV